MNEQCPICMCSQYLLIQVCSQWHKFCPNCVEQWIQKASNRNRTCPICREYLSYSHIEKIRSAIGKVPILLKWIQNVNFLLGQSPKLFLGDRNEIIWRLFRSAIKQTSFQLALQFLLRQIQKQPNDEEIFIGLGCNQEMVGFAQNEGYQWFEENMNISRLSLYDQLAVILFLNPQENRSKWYQKIINKDSQNVRAVLGLAINHHNSGQKTLATEYYEQVIRLRPDFDKPFELLAFLYYQTNNANKAQQFANMALLRNPDNIFAQYIIAAVGNIHKQNILEKLQKVIRVMPNYVRALHLYGKLLSNDPKSALQIFENCQRINHNYINPLIQRSGALIQLQSFSYALQNLLKIQNPHSLPQLDKDNYYYYLGVAYQNCAKIDEALIAYANVKEERHFGLSFKKAELYFQQKQWKSALKNYLKTPQIIHNDIGILSKVITCCQQAKQFDQKIYWLQEMSNFAPNNHQICFQIGQAYQFRQDYTNSVKWYKKSLENGFRRHEIYPKMIEILRLNNQLQESCAYAKQFKKCNLSKKEIEYLATQDRINSLKMKNAIR